MKPVLLIVGNTGTGKSQISIDLAHAYNGEIINGDSIQVYQGIDTVSNKHPLDERKGIPHHLLGHVKWDEPAYDVVRFKNEALAAIEDIHSRGKLPIVVGGTHYYIQALVSKASLIAGKSETPSTLTDEQLRILDDPAKVENMLAQYDPAILQKFHSNDTRRLRRALEVYYTTQKPASKHYAEQLDEVQSDLRFKTMALWVHCERQTLQERLNTRIDKMITQGNLLDELRELHQAVNGRVAGPSQAIGYPQFLPYLTQSSNDTKLFDQCVESMKAATRQYAKTQTKWIKNKLSPFLKERSATFGAVDSTDLSKWPETQAQAEKLVGNWLKDVAMTESELIPESILPESMRSKPAYDESQWQRHRCEECSKWYDCDFVLIGAEAFEAHRKSKRHQKALRRKSARISTSLHEESADDGR